ncbi:plasma-membrane proton-efflux P-type ATPase [Rhodovulum sp. DZ06]|uniref:plasma-membrane proton-efflux P-type ATPase n=1 Tax=Rhodovulum sp. DZ06 TaxID=3425126 RepID=UPI003D3515BB
MSADAQTPDLSTLPLEDAMARLGAGPEGLTDAEAAERLSRYGPNALPEKQESALRKLLRHFWGPIPWMIEIAALLSALAGHWADCAIIVTLLCANGFIGWYEEREAGDAIAALRSRLAAVARVRRGGAWRQVPAAELVPGDIVHLRLGDVVPADVRILDEGEAELDQSSLTGESLPAQKGRGDAAFSGSILRQGEFDALVHATGEGTFFGRTARLVEDAQAPSHFQTAVRQIGHFLILFALGLVSVIVLASLFRGDPALEVLQFALVLTVAAIPVALPTVLSVTMAVGARLLAKKQAIVSRLTAIEELAGADVLCSDKTGTLTLNQLTLGPAECLGGASEADVLRAAALASRPEGGDAIDAAVLGAQIPDLTGWHVTHFKPFDPVSKHTEAEADGPRGRIRVAKGAPQVIAAMANLSGDALEEEQSRIDALAARGFRALGVAQADGDGPWRMLGVLPLFDPPRDSAAETIARARAMGIDVKMITGDQLAIAKETARALDLGDGILDAEALGDVRHHQRAASDDAVERADGFAQVFPEHKHHIVDVLQRRGHIVAMTGDGVNDAPALKKADCGIAVSGATDAARAAADIVLTDPGLSVVVDAAQEARRIFQRMNAYAIYRIAETLRVLLFMALAILAFDFYPLTAVMIVMLALLNDGAILSIAYDNAEAAPGPVRWNMRRVLGAASVLGAAGPIASFGLFYIAEREFALPRDQVQTLMYLLLSVAGHLTVFLARTEGPFWSSRPSNALLGAVVGTQVLATIIALAGVFMTPLPWEWAAAAWGWALAWFLLTDVLKRVAYAAAGR